MSLKLHDLATNCTINVNIGAKSANSQFDSNNSLSSRSCFSIPSAIWSNCQILVSPSRTICYMKDQKAVNYRMTSYKIYKKNSTNKKIIKKQLKTLKCKKKGLK